MGVASGTRLGPYEVVSLLGVGGMGEVYQARDERLNRMVAVKLLPAELVANSERRKRFVQEAQLASSLQHPHIITIFDIGSSEHGEYLAMELVRGQTLDQIIPQRGMRLPEALRYGVQITDALAAAHGAGIVHRDLKPGNIMVTDQGQIKILDFGLATLTEHQSVSPADETRVQSDALKTGAGTILGTVAYMSPEQAEGRKVDARSDLFSFGSILYEMLSGKRAFRADSTPGTLAAVINLDPAPLAKVVEDIPQAVERLVSRCLKKDLSRRAQHASDIKVALEELQEDSESLSAASAARPASSAQRSGLARPLWAIAVLVLVVAIGGAFVLWQSRSTPPPPSVVVAVPLTTFAGSEQAPTFSPDGTQIAFGWTREGATLADVHVQIIGGGAPLRLTDDGSTHVGPTWSPDGKSIAVWHLQAGRGAGAVGDVKLVLLSPLGGPEREVLTWVGVPSRIVWSPDNRWLASSPAGVRSDREKGITLISASTNERIEWAAIDKSYGGSVEPAFSPDGRRIAFARRRDDFSSDLFLADVGSDGRPTGPPVPLPAAGQNARFPLWTADGRELIFIDGVFSSNGGIVRVPVDGSRPFQRIAGLEHATTIGLSADRTKLAFGRGGLDVDIWRIDLRSGTSGRIAASTLHEEAADPSPDGRRLAFSSNRQGPREIWVSDITGDNALPLTRFGGPIAGTAHWSPDGRSIAFDARPAGNSEIFVVPASGGAVKQLTQHPGEDARPTWSHDGTSIYFVSDRGGRSNIWRMSADGSNPMQISKMDALWIAPSHTNNDIYYTEAVFATGIRRLREDGTDEVVVNESARFIATSKSGLWFGVNPKPGERSMPIKMLRVSDGSIREVARVDFVASPVGMSVTADEQSILVTRPDVSGTDLWLVEGFR